MKKERFSLRDLLNDVTPGNPPGQRGGLAPSVPKGEPATPYEEPVVQEPVAIAPPAEQRHAPALEQKPSSVPVTPFVAEPGVREPQPEPQPAPAHGGELVVREKETRAVTAINTSQAASFSIDSMRDILLGMGVKASHVEIAMRRTAQTGEPLAQIMRDFGFLSGEGVAQAVSLQTRFPYFSAEDAEQINKADLKGVPLKEFKKYVPVGKDSQNRLLVAVPDGSVVNEAQNAYYNYKTQMVVASERTIQQVYRKHFANSAAAFDKLVQQFAEITAPGRKKEDDETAVGLIRDIYFGLLRHACYSGASDLYLYRSDYIGIVRLKINGVGTIFRTIDLNLYDRLLNKLVQDNTKAEDLRVRPKESIVEFNEDDKKRNPDLANRFGFRLELTESRGIRSAVIRILDKNASATDLEKLGFDKDTYEAIAKVAKTSTGFFLVTGPTGSGKTTSLYAILKSIDAVERSVQSIENPIEYKHGLWMQFETRKDAQNEGEEANEWLKALLRNAPDVILVGEVRDKGVANICLNAANTGHLVFATLHTNDAVMAMARLKSMEIDLDVLGSVLLGILAQRLLRLLCKDCKVPDNTEYTRKLLAGETYLGAAIRKPFQAGAGCPNCDYTGYRGRRMIYELLQMNPNVREALEKGEPPSVLARHGMPEERTMWATGARLVAEGLTSLEELERVATKHE